VLNRINADEAKLFHRIVAQCLYLACRARLRYSSLREYKLRQYYKLTRLFKYLNGTKELSIMLGGDVSGNIGLTIYADAATARISL